MCECEFNACWVHNIAICIPYRVGCGITRERTFRSPTWDYIYQSESEWLMTRTHGVWVDVWRRVEQSGTYQSYNDYKQTNAGVFVDCQMITSATTHFWINYESLFHNNIIELIATYSIPCYSRLNNVHDNMNIQGTQSLRRQSQSDAIIWNHCERWLYSSAKHISEQWKLAGQPVRVINHT